MSFINKLPKTNFTLPSGEVVETRNIFKTLIVDDNTKNNLDLVKIKNGTTIPKLENISHQFYGTKKRLYWLTTHLNNIDSFSNMPIPQSNFKLNLQRKYPGMIYYSHGGKQIKFSESDLENVTDKTNTIKQGDLIILLREDEENNPPSENNWVSLGIVKEYDPVFRRIILQEEVLNSENTKNDLREITIDSGPKLFVYRKNEESSWGQIGDQSGFMCGVQELEYKKAISIHNETFTDPEISPFKFVLTNDYDFSDTPSESTIIFSLSIGTLNSLYVDTLESEQKRSNIKNNTIRYMETPNAYELTGFIETLIGTTFRRGQVVGFES